MARSFLAGVLALALLVAACSAQDFTSDDARKLGTPQQNQCGRLCGEVAKRNPKLAQLLNYCQTQCIKCVAQVAQTKPGARAPLPSTCKQAFDYKPLMSVVYEYVAQEKAQTGRRL